MLKPDDPTMYATEVTVWSDLFGDAFEDEVLLFCGGWFLLGDIAGSFAGFELVVEELKLFWVRKGVLVVWLNLKI